MNINPYKNSFLRRKIQIEKMFNIISKRYDLINRILSFGIDIKWRKKILYILNNNNIIKSNILDVASGTGDMTIMLAKYFIQSNITGLDLSQEMLNIAKKKILKKNIKNNIKLIKGDVENIPIESNTFDVVTIIFGIRNFENIESSLNEIYRILKPKGLILILEFSKPKNLFIKFIYKIYSFYILIITKIISNDPIAYEYLIKSIDRFTSVCNINKILKSIGFSYNKIIPLTFGIVSIYQAQKIIKK